MSIPIVNAWQLNERHYGALQGLDKQMTVDKYGKDKVRPSRHTTRPIDTTKHNKTQHTRQHAPSNRNQPKPEPSPRLSIVLFTSSCVHLTK